MKKLNIVSMDFTNYKRFCCSRKRAYEEQKIMKIATSYIHEEEKIPSIILLQGDSLDSRIRNIDRDSLYRAYVDSNTSSAIMVPRDFDVANWGSFLGIGSTLVVPVDNHYLSFFSVSLTKKKDFEKFMKFYQSTRDFSCMQSQVIGGSFPSKKSLKTITEDYDLLDVSSGFYFTSSELKNNRYSILLSSNMAYSDTTRQTGLVKEKHLKHCPISTKIHL